MITNRSTKREIRDLQRLLVCLGYMEPATGKDKGWWSAETQAAVVMAYKMIGREKNAVQAWEKFVRLEPGHKDSATLRKLIAKYYEENPR